MSGTTIDNCFITAQSFAFHGCDSSTTTTTIQQQLCSSQLNVCVCLKFVSGNSDWQLRTKCTLKLPQIQKVFMISISFYLAYKASPIVYFAFRKYIQIIYSLASILYLCISGITYFNGIFFFSFSSKNWVHISLTKIHITEFESQFKIQANTSQLPIFQVSLKVHCQIKAQKLVFIPSPDLQRCYLITSPLDLLTEKPVSISKDWPFVQKEQSTKIC